MNTQQTTAKGVTGKIVSIRGQVVVAVFDGQQPDLYEVLQVEGESAARLEVIISSAGRKFFCLALTDAKKLHRGMKLVGIGKQLELPMGEAVLGRVIDIFGAVHDEGGPIQAADFKGIHRFALPEFGKIRPAESVMETGIKAIDFFCPILQGGKVGLFGGAGVGKTILLTELIHNSVVLDKRTFNKDSAKPAGEQATQSGMDETYAVFSAVGERSREAQELYESLRESDVFKRMTLILGQMGENPAVRSRTALSGAALAAYFRDVMHKNVLFLMDNMYRFAQAGHELSIMMNSIPSEDGYQPTLASEMGQLHERLLSTDTGYVTGIEAVFVPSDDMTDYGVRSIFPYLDAFVILSRDVYQQGRLPAIDLLTSTSTALTEEVVGKGHYQTYIQAKGLLEQAATLEKIVALVGFSELSFEDQTVYKRAVLLRNYMTQSFFVTEDQTGNKGVFMPLKDTVEDVKALLKGQYDIVHPEKLLWVGKLSEVS
jgi:F-type H+-transporting ATPase subunit beta